MRYQDIITRYYYDDGWLYYRENLSPRARAGDRAGTLAQNGYYRIKYDGRIYQAHRLIYCYFNECDYSDIDGWDIDHLDNDRTNNKIDNLILCEHWENQLNRIDTKENGCLWKDNPIRIQRKRVYDNKRYRMMSKADKDRHNARSAENRRRRGLKNNKVT